MLIKICGITRREDALAAVDAGASALGFIFYKPSPRYVTPEQAAEVSAGLTVSKVGVFVDETPAAIEDVMRVANLDIAQIYGEAVPDGFRIWRAFRIAGETGIQTVNNCEAVFLDSARSGIPFDWRIARGAATRLIIAGGLHASNVREAIRAAEPWGVDASSSLESAPGIKDHRKIQQFVRAVQEAS